MRCPVRKSVLALVACSWASCTLPQGRAPKTPLEALTVARAQLDAKNASRALRVLQGVEESSFRGEDKVRYKVLLGEALLETDEHYDAYQAVVEISTENPTSAWRKAAEYVHFESGRRLASSGGSFLGLVTDLDDAVAILRRFVTYWPRSSRVPEALRILGEAAYLTRDYETAIYRFAQLVQINASPELTDLAASRIAMAHFEQVRGHEYDAGQMTRAREELSNYLARARDAERIDQARKALAQTIRWQEARALHDARFYLTLARPRAAMISLQELLTQPDVERREEAEALRDRARALLETQSISEAEAAGEAPKKAAEKAAERRAEKAAEGGTR